MTPCLSAEWISLLYQEARRQRPELPDLNPTTQAVQVAPRISPSVIALSQGLTRARTLAGTRYLNERDAALAYLLYYLPVNVARTERVLLQLPPSYFGTQGKQAGGILRVLDLGSGPGTQLVALLHHLGAMPDPRDAEARGTRWRLQYRAVDHSQKALQQLQHLAARAKSAGLIPSWLELELEVKAGALESTTIWASGLAPESLELVMMGYVVNELKEGQVSAPEVVGYLQPVLACLKPEGVLLLVEPALQETALRLQQVRDGLVQQGMVPLSPCTHLRPCPLAAPSRPARQWCHEELQWQRPALIEAVDRLTGLDKERAAFSHLLMQRNMTKKDAELSQNEAGASAPLRVMSPALNANGTMSVYLCGPHGFMEAMRLNRHSTANNGAFDGLKRGDVIRLEAVQVKGGKWRVEGETQVEVLSEA